MINNHMTTLTSYENYIFSTLERAAQKLQLKESDQKDKVTLDVPLLIRLLELAREDIKSDPELHNVVERILDLKNEPILTMHHYDYIVNKETENSPPIPQKNSSSDDELSSLKKLAGL